jgi:NAD(P)-dependent dehydrogenase (short-subunit alcohol dehydrogenase family)
MDYSMQGLGFEQGDVVVVTGAASGIGRATAKTAARAGLTVWGWDIMGGQLAAVVEEIKQDGGDAIATVCDVRDPDAVARTWDEAGRIGAPRYLVNNAGPASNTELTYQEGLDQATGSMVLVTEQWLSRFGEVAEATTFTSSIAAEQGGWNWYSVAKAAIKAYTRTIARLYRGKPRANAVAPGLIITPRTLSFGSEMIESMAKRVPMGRNGQPEEVATVICFLLSPAASFINGVYLPVDGGALL